MNSFCVKDEEKWVWGAGGDKMETNKGAISFCSLVSPAYCYKWWHTE